MSDLEMPPRQSGDGNITVERTEDGGVALSVTTDGQVQSVKMGAFNAWRAVGLLAFILGIPLPARITRAIKLS